MEIHPSITLVRTTSSIFRSLTWERKTKSIFTKYSANLSSSSWYVQVHSFSYMKARPLEIHTIDTSWWLCLRSLRIWWDAMLPPSIGAYQCATCIQNIHSSYSRNLLFFYGTQLTRNFVWVRIVRCRHRRCGITCHTVNIVWKCSMSITFCIESRKKLLISIIVAKKCEIITIHPSRLGLYVIDVLRQELELSVPYLHEKMNMNRELFAVFSMIHIFNHN